MKDVNSNSRMTKRKSKKKRIFLYVLLLLFLFILGIFLYFYWQYHQGFASSSKETKFQNKKIEFNGKKDPLGTINILLLGIDAKGDRESRTDSILIAQYNPETKKSKLVSIMRDSYVDIPGHGKHKINRAYTVGGPELLRRTIKQNFDIDIESYAMIDFKGFEKMIDAAFPEGIEVNVEKKMSRGIGMTLYPGVQKLHGKELLAYVRFRKDARSDFGRVERQQKVLKTIVDEVASVKGIVKIPGMIGTIQPYISTNVDNTTILSIITAFFSDKNRNIETLRIPIDGSFKDSYYPEDGDVLELDIEKNKQALKEFLNQ